MMRAIKFVMLCFTIVVCSAANGQEKAKSIEKMDMKMYYLVFLKSGPDRSQDSVTAANLQKEHLAHLTKMYTDGKMDICGPMAEEGDIRGICIYNVATKEEAEKLANADPMVKSGRLKVEVHPFYSAKGVSLK